MMPDVTLLAGLMVALCPPMGAEHGDYEAEMKKALLALADLPQAGGAAGDGEPSLVGQWDAPEPWPVIAIHSAMLPTGKVLQYSYPDGTDGSRAMLYDPITGKFDDVSMGTDLFCSGLSLLGDGTVFVTGGNDYACEFQGRVTTFIFDPIGLSWTPQDTMSGGRWYPTNTTLSDGRVLITTGLDLDCDTNPIMDLFTPGEGIEAVPEGMGYLPLFARMHLISDGRVVFVGESQDTFAFTLGSGWERIGSSNLGYRGQNTSVLVPGRTDQIMIIGGYHGDSGPTATCEIIDMAAETPAWAYTGSLNHGRAHADALILPDATVLVCGGGRVDLYGEPVNVPELFDPETETWTELPSHVFGRMYHATTVLLPDGRVLVAGQDSGPSAYIGEIYNPPYLYRGARPVIDAAPASVVYGQSFDISTRNAASVENVALVRLTAVTHSVNFEQRYVGLEFAEGEAGSLTATVPDNPNLAPPGYYMLFILNDLGVPSVSTMVHVGPPHPADVNQDGTVDVDDLVAVILAWGDCPPGPCPADIDGNGEVEVDDLVAVILGWSD